MSQVLDAFIEEFPVIIDIPIHWGDMDAFQHVNNVIYYRYFESARIAYFMQTNIMSELQERQVGPILASSECRFKRPVTFPDTLKIGCKTSDLKEQDFIQEYSIYSTQQDAITTVGKARIVMIDYKTGQKVNVSDTIRQAIASKESKPKE